MKKYCIFGLMVSMIPALCMAEHPRVTELIRIKQDKMAQLEKCSGTTKGLKIAGISTLGVTAVGVAGNIAEAAVINKYDKKIEDTGKKINDTQLEIDQKLKDNIDKQNREDERQRRIAEEQQKQQAAQDESRRLKNVVAQDIATINSRGGTIGDVAASHGYLPEQLPTKIGNNMRSDFADAMINFITKCRKLIGTNGIKDVSLSTSDADKWRNIGENNVLDENAILTDLNEYKIAQCNATECDTTTHTLSNGTCVPNGTTPDNNNNGTTPDDQNKGGDCKSTLPATAQTLALTATYNDGKCQIDTCVNGFKPSDDGQSCVKDDGGATTPKDGDDCKTNGALVAKWSTRYDKCVAKTCDEQNGWELVMKNGQSQGWCNKKKGESTPDKKEQTPAEEDCTTTMQKGVAGILVEKAVVRDGKCKIVSCKKDTVPSEDGQSCIVKEGADCTAVVPNASKATVNGNVCKVDTCKDNFKPSSDGKSCERVDCKKGTFADYSVNKVTYRNGRCEIDTCNGGFVPSEDKQKCVPNNSAKKETEPKEKNKQNISFFNKTQVNLAQGKNLVGLYARIKGLSLNYVPGSEDINTFGQDYIVYEDSDTQYKFEFEDLSEHEAYDRKISIADVICKLYGASGEKRYDNVRHICYGLDINDCDANSMNSAVKSVDSSLGIRFEKTTIFGPPGICAIYFN